MALKPNTRAYATGLWSARRGLATPKDAVVARDALFDCDRRSCAPKPCVQPAIGAWWSKVTPPDGRLDELCRQSDILIIRYAFEAPPSCRGRIVLHGADFKTNGAAEIYVAAPASAERWRIEWAQLIRGDRPWTRSSEDGG